MFECPSDDELAEKFARKEPPEFDEDKYLKDRQEVFKLTGQEPRDSPYLAELPNEFT